VVRVFLSSTFRDLEPHRAAVIAAIDSLDGHECVCMERFGARAWFADDFCLRQARECDVFVGLLGHYYGSCPWDCDTSYTEREYDAAAGKDRLMFLVPEGVVTADLPPEPPATQQKQQDFRLRASAEQIRDTFVSPHDLAWRALRAIHNWQHERGTPGPVVPLPPQPHFAHPYPLQDHFTGRREERRTLTEWFASGAQSIFAYVALGGFGKSALTWAWLQRDVLGFPLPGMPEPSFPRSCLLPGLGRNVVIPGLVSLVMDISHVMLDPVVPLFLTAIPRGPDDRRQAPPDRPGPPRPRRQPRRRHPLDPRRPFRALPLRQHVCPVAGFLSRSGVRNRPASEAG